MPDLVAAEATSLPPRWLHWCLQSRQVCFREQPAARVRSPLAHFQRMVDRDWKWARFRSPAPLPAQLAEQASSSPDRTGHGKPRPPSCPFLREKPKPRDDADPMASFELATISDRVA